MISTLKPSAYTLTSFASIANLPLLMASLQSYHFADVDSVAIFAQDMILNP